MAKRTVEQNLLRSKDAWEIKDRWRSLFEEAYDLVLPGLNPYRNDKENPRPMDKQFDSTATKSAIRLANRLLSELTPPDQNWMQLRVGPALEAAMNDDKDEINKVNSELSKISRMANMVVNQGDMVDARGMAFLDMVIAGTGILLDMKDEKSKTNIMISQCVSQSEVAIETDARGMDVGFYRKREMFVDNIKILWPDATLTDELAKLEKDKDRKKVTVDEITYLDTDTEKWRYEVIYSVGDKNKGLIFEREHTVCPWTVFRWLRLPGMPYGPGPVLLTLADIRTANKIVEMVLKNAAIALAGMYLARDDGVLNPDNILITPGAIIPVGSTGGTMGASLTPLPTSRNFDIAQLILGDFQKRIRSGLYDDSLPEVSGNPRSATEIINRIRELTQDIGGAMGRLTSDVVQYGRKIVSILVETGNIKHKFKVDQFTIKMQINSPLANAQQMREVENTTQWIQSVISIGGQQAPQIIAKLPLIYMWMAERMGVPMEFVNDNSEQQKAISDMAAAAGMQMAPAGALQQAA